MNSRQLAGRRIGSALIARRIARFTRSPTSGLIRFGASKGTLTRDKTARAMALLAAEPAELAARRHGLREARARILPAGAVIVDAILRHYGAESLRVSEAGLREGLILATTHAGIAWRDRLPELAHGWRV